jgi:hypothetical protein
MKNVNHLNRNLGEVKLNEMGEKENNFCKK